MDVYWKNGWLEKVNVPSKKGGPCKLKYNNEVIEFDAEVGDEYTFNKNRDKVL